MYSAKLYNTVERERKTFQDKNKSKEFISTKPALHRTLEAILENEETHKHSKDARQRN